MEVHRYKQIGNFTLVKSMCNWTETLNYLVEFSYTTDFKELNIAQKIEYCSKNDNIRYALQQILNAPKERKSLSASIEFREKGTKLFCKGCWRESIEIFTLAACHASVDSSEWALAIGNRSAALLHLKVYDDSLEDIQRALSGAYPEILRAKLYHRREKILGLKKLAVPVTASVCKQNDDIPAFQKSDTLPYVLSKLKLSWCAAKGNHVVTDSLLSCDELLFEEPPFAFVILKSHFHKLCYNCLKDAIAPIPCILCVNVVFCCDNCVVSSNHQWDCGYLALLGNMGVANLVYKIAVTAGPSRMLQQRKCQINQITSGAAKHPSKSVLICDDVKEHNIVQCEKTSEDRYEEVYNLQSHLDDMEPKDLFQYTVTAVFLVLILKQQGLEISSEDMMKLCESVLRHIAQVICNAHVITDQDQPIACALYPFASMLNHSCQPNIKNRLLVGIL